MSIHIVAAVSENGVIGCEGKMPWNLPEDLKHFRRITEGGVVIMGRITYESIGHPLPGRVNIIVTSRKIGADVQTADSLPKAIEAARKMKREIFLCGGEAIYREGMEYADVLHLTKVQVICRGDTFFPEISSDFQLAYETEMQDILPCRICVYKRRIIQNEQKTNVDYGTCDEKYSQHLHSL